MTTASPSIGISRPIGKGRSPLVDAELLLLLYAGINSDEALSDFLAALAQSFDCCSAALFYVDRRRPAAAFSMAHGRIAERAVQALYVEKYAVLDPAPRAMARLAVGDVASTDQIFTGPALERHRDFLEGFYYAVGLGGALGGPLVRGEGRVGMIAVQRDLERARFDESDIARFRALMPFIIQALDLRRRFFDADAALSRLEAALAPVKIGVLSFDETAALQHANPAARALLARRDGLSIDLQGRLHADDPRAERDLQAWFVWNNEGAGARFVTVPRKELGKAPYVVRISSTSCRAQDSRANGFTAVISDTSRTVDEGAYIVGAVYRLSPEAARLVDALVGGDDLATYANRAGISINTAKYHLKMAFAATGTRRQIDLLRLVLTLLRDLG